MTRAKCANKMRQAISNLELRKLNSGEMLTATSWGNLIGDFNSFYALIQPRQRYYLSLFEGIKNYG